MYQILLVDNNDSFTYNLVETFRNTGKCLVIPEPVQKITAHMLDKYHGVVISPGPGLPDERKELNGIIETCIMNNKPLLGVCLGHQAIVQYFGGKLRHLNRIIHGESTEATLMVKDKIYHGLPLNIRVGRYHSWIVDEETLPQQLMVTASTKDNLVMSITHLSMNIVGLQYHPESILTPEGAVILKNWIDFYVQPVHQK